MAMLADLIHALDREHLMAIVYRDAECACGSASAWVTVDTHEFVCGKCRRHHAEVLQVSVVREVLKDLALAFGEALDAYQAQRRTLLIGAKMPASIGAYVLGEPCSNCGLHPNALGATLALLAQAS